MLDFGIARSTRGTVDAHATTAAALASITAEGVAIGTPSYMSPEQLRGGEVDARADQFAWGVMAYEMLVGSTPWSGARTPSRSRPRSSVSPRARYDRAPLGSTRPPRPS